MNKLNLIIVIAIIAVLPSVFAFGPNTHMNITMKALAATQGSLITDLINENLDGCLAGIEYPDAGIFKYYTDFTDYAGLHNYNVPECMLQEALTDDDRAFAYCYKLHLAEDAVSHNYYVPIAIKQSKLPNYIIHPIHELKIEDRYIDPRTTTLMEQHKKFDWLITKCTNQDWSADAEKLNKILGGGDFYNSGYRPEDITWWGKFQNAAFKFIGWFVSPNTGVDYYNLAVAEATTVLNGETPAALDPAGAAALNAADKQTSFWLYVGSLVVIIVLFWLSWKYDLIWRPFSK